MTRKEFLESVAGMATSTFVATTSFAATRPRPQGKSLAAGKEKKVADTQSVFTIGNHHISRSFEVNGKQASTTALQARTQLRVASAEFSVTCRTTAREVVLTRYNTNPASVIVSPSREETELAWSADSPALDIHVFYQTDGERPRIFKWIEIDNRSDLPVRIVSVTVESLEISAGGEPLRGGVGQPVELKNEFFLGIEHPAAANEARARNIILSHYPDAKVAPGDTWKSKRAVLGAAIEGESLEHAFHRYLADLTGRSANFEPIYNDWGAHDELGTLVKPQLTEQLTLELLDQLESMKLKYGTQFNDYVLDAFWYDPRGAYLTIKQPNWPRGYEPTLQHIQALGMKPGLWFDLGGGTLDLKNTPGWGGPEKPCLSDPEFTHLVERAVEFHARHHSLTLLKFDFANLLCRHGEVEQPSLAVLEKNADGLREVCDKARLANPAMVILAFNVFSMVEMMESTIRYDEAYPVSPWWLLWFDALYSGDPRPSEVPSVTSLRDSVIWYQDQVFRGFARSWLPPFMIDDCGTIVGKTSTIYYLGSECFTDSWILNVMRGAHSPTLYGDLRLLSENDRRFLAASIRFLHEYEPILTHTRPILGVPGRGEVYGYFASQGDLALVTVVNPGLYPQSFLVPLAGQARGDGLLKLVFSNDGRAREELRPANGVLEGELVPGEIRIYGLGPEAKVAPMSLPSASTRQFHQITPLADLFGGKRVADFALSPEHEGMTLAIIIQYQKDGRPDRSYTRPQEICKVTGDIASKAVIFTSIPAEGTDIWSKCSWAVFKCKIARNETGETLRLRLVGDPPAGTDRAIQSMWLQ
ncbi:MAG: hypothetical protein ABSA41_20570 [Terriglobia bacterium]|jgi:hypothetical protein